MTLDERLFRREAGRMVAALTHIFGVHNLDLAEDVVQDALCRALEVWKFRGVPDNPGAWLMTAAKHRALDVIRRERTARRFASEVGQLLDSEWTAVPALDELLEMNAIRDDELRMMFSCCHPKVPEDAQVALVLHILCGFGPHEVASAFLCTTAAIEKRIARGKKVLAGANSLFDLSSIAEFAPRLRAVQRALYLLFNEGYHGAGQSAVRVELCEEALRMTMLLLEYSASTTPSTQALAALMCLHAARQPARVDGAGDLIPLVEQDRALWDAQLIAQGLAYLDRSAVGSELTEYHVEAAIAATHAEARSLGETRWDRVVSLYDMLLSIRYSPVVALQRALAVGELAGATQGLSDIRAIAGQARLAEYPFYFAAIAELERRRGNHEQALASFRMALSLARNGMERRFLAARIEGLDCTQARAAPHQIRLP